MSRYIDTEWLENNAKEYSLGYYEADEWATPLSILDSAPSIDIIFCKECEHGTWHEQTEMYICSANDQDLYEAEHFCSYGERREP